MAVQERNIPVHLITGFLGSGKTTLLTRLIDYYHALDQKVAIVMNELGDVNLDGTLMDREVPMSEMLGGCICCSIRGDLGMEIQELVAAHRPDVILIESTGAANPLEIIDGVTEAALLVRVELQSVITVVDGPELLERGRNGKGATFRLMKEQIRCATHLIVNKADRLYPEQVVEVQQLVREWNQKAELVVTVKAVVDAAVLLGGSVKRGAVRIQLASVYTGSKAIILRLRRNRAMMPTATDSLMINWLTAGIVVRMTITQIAGIMSMRQAMQAGMCITATAT